MGRNVCLTCEYFHQQERFGECGNVHIHRQLGPAGECRLSPPVVPLTCEGQHRDDTPGHWPIVFASGWCGQHRRRLTLRTGPAEPDLQGLEAREVMRGPPAPPVRGQEDRREEDGDQPTVIIDGSALTIRWNNLAAGGICPVCGGPTDPQEGPELCIRGTWKVVCHECGKRLNPELMATLQEMWDDPAWPHHAYLFGRAETPSR